MKYRASWVDLTLGRTPPLSEQPLGQVRLEVGATRGRRAVTNAGTAGAASSPCRRRPFPNWPSDRGAMSW